MYKKTMTYEDFAGNTVNEDFYFNLTKAEILRLEASREGGLSSFLEQIVEKQDGAQILEAFETIIKASVGKRSDDGRRFIKTQEVQEDFIYSNAYSDFLMEVATDAKVGAEFVNAVMPKELADLVADNDKPTKKAVAPRKAVASRK